MNSEEAFRLLHAYVDGELDPVKSGELEAHLAADPAARAACERLRAMSSTIRDKAEYFSAPASLEARLRASIPVAPGAETRRPVAWAWLKPAASFAAVALLTWVIAAGVMHPGADERIAQDVVSAHVRATLAGRLYDVASSDRHTVKPWLSARLDYSPPVSDFTASGFPLAGGRLDYVDGRPVAVLSYKYRQHTIDVFVWPAAAEIPARAETRDGFNVERFARTGMSFWVISDLARGELDELVRLLAANSATS